VITAFDSDNKAFVFTTVETTAESFVMMIFFIGMAANRLD